MPVFCGTGCGAGLHWQACLWRAATRSAGSTGFDIENTVSYQCFILLTAMLMLSAAKLRKLYRARFAAQPGFCRAWVRREQPLHYRVQIKNLTAKPRQGWCSWKI